MLELDDGTILTKPVLAGIPTVVDEILEPDLSGLEIGNYQVKELIGKGGMGLVYRGERFDGTFKKDVAIKLLSRGRLSDIEIKRFEIERKILASLDHPNISRLIDGGITDSGEQFLVMEFIDGIPIDRYCEENDLPIRERLRLILKVCDALRFAHQKLVVHRDLKPKNILVDKSGNPFLLDFGIAKILDSSEILGDESILLGSSLVSPSSRSVALLESAGYSERSGRDGVH